MITDIKNLGPPMKASPDLKSPKVKKDREEPGADSFEQTFSDKVSRGGPEKSPGTNAQRVRPPDQAEKPETSETRIENKEPNDSVTVKKGDPANLKNLSERQRVMQDFMDSMESEFGIPPQRLVEAMAQLPEEKLFASPEETASEVISQLDLGPEDSQKAESMYLGFLAHLSATLPQVRDPEPLSPQMKAALGSGGLMAGMKAPELISSRERRQALNQSLDQMNSKFFMKPGQEVANSMVSNSAVKPVTEDTVGKAESLLQRAQGFEEYKSYQPMGSKTLDSIPVKDLDPSLPSVAPAPTQAPPPVQIANTEMLNQMQPLSDDESSEQLIKDLLALGAAAGALSQAVKEDPKNATALKMEQSLQAEGPQTPSWMPPVQTSSMMSGNAKGDDSSFGQKDKESARADKMSVKPSTGEPTPFVVDSALVKDSPRSLPRADVSQVSSNFVGAQVASGQNRSEEANIQHVLNQTQYLIKKGGGEAAVTMSPEGMGQVHLKVLVNEGKVNVQMQTETMEAKKAIESSLGDLRASLNTHKLAIDHVKVDVGNQMASDSSNQQSKMDFQQDPGRESARQFLGQFRQDNLGNRTGFFETSGVKAYGKKDPSAPLAKADAVKSSSVGRYQGSGKGSGLDLVA